MTPAQFEKHIEPRWQKLERLMNDAESSKPKADVIELPDTFRQVCHDLSVAQHRLSPQRLTQKLNLLAIRGYRILERRTAGGLEAFIHMMLVMFPQLVRKEWRLFGWCSAIFYCPLIVLVTITPHYPEWSMALLGADGMGQAEEMYGHGSDLVETLRGKFGSDFAMFCFYIWNNVGIDFKTFAGGLAGGVGSLFVLLFNGLHIGALAGYIRYAGDPESLLLWVSGHSALELTGMVISAMAGCRLGLTVLKPGRMLRRDALVLAGRQALPMMIGAAMMTCFAAVIEGFWSPRQLAPFIKYSFGIVQWLLVAAFLIFSGRRRAHAA